MRRLLDKLRNRKGISMTEVVIAMAVVVIVTGAAISLLVASAQFDAKYEEQTRALNACESAAQCIRFATTEAELGGYLERLGFSEVDGVFTFDGDTVEVKKNGEGRWTVTFDGEEIYGK